MLVLRKCFLDIDHRELFIQASNHETSKAENGTLPKIAKS